jgi:hypothetical protein
MSGVSIISALLRDSTAVADAVAAANIKGGKLADDAPLPSLLVRSLSLVDRQTLAREETVRSTERVSVTARAASYREQRAIIKLVRATCTTVTLAALDDARNIAVLTAGAGPDLNGPGDSFERSQDFYVTYDAPA